ncbi:MAG: hypothetical protein Q4F81_12295 [Eubacteriales bacterium]|nr:hypothetical protein [Eubacteriales bacterium]
MGENAVELQGGYEKIRGNGKKAEARPLRVHAHLTKNAPALGVVHKTVKYTKGVTKVVTPFALRG